MLRSETALPHLTHRQEPGKRIKAKAEMDVREKDILGIHTRFDAGNTAQHSSHQANPEISENQRTRQNATVLPT